MSVRPKVEDWFGEECRIDVLLQASVLHRETITFLVHSMEHDYQLV